MTQFAPHTIRDSKEAQALAQGLSWDAEFWWLVKSAKVPLFGGLFGCVCLLISIYFYLETLACSFPTSAQLQTCMSSYVTRRQKCFTSCFLTNTWENYSQTFCSLSALSSSSARVSSIDLRPYQTDRSLYWASWMTGWMVWPRKSWTLLLQASQQPFAKSIFHKHLARSMDLDESTWSSISFCGLDYTTL